VGNQQPVTARFVQLTISGGSMKTPTDWCFTLWRGWTPCESWG